MTVPSIPEDELRKVVVAHMLKYGNDFAERLQDKNITEDVDEEVATIMAAIRQYAAKERLDELDSVQFGLGRYESLTNISGEILSIDERIKQLKEGL